MIISLVLKSALSEIITVNPASFLLVSAWYIFLCPFTFNLPVSLYLEWVLYRQSIIDSFFFIYSDSLLTFNWWIWPICIYWFFSSLWIHIYHDHNCLLFIISIYPPPFYTFSGFKQAFHMIPFSLFSWHSNYSSFNNYFGRSGSAYSTWLSKDNPLSPFIEVPRSRTLRTFVAK